VSIMPTRILPQRHPRNPPDPSQITTWRPSPIRFICCDGCPKERSSTGHGLIRRIIHMIVAPGSVTSALMPLRMARKLDPYRETARMALEPWLVEAALARFPQTLSPADQRTIVKATRTPHQVRWPEWWNENP
jgi:hypothetical protein